MLPGHKMKEDKTNKLTDGAFDLGAWALVAVSRPPKP